MATGFSIAPLRWLGLISYGLYLYHWPIVVLLDRPRVDWAPVPLFGGDRFVLCSDGFHGYVESMDEMRYFLDLEVEDAVLESIRFANAKGGKDNITTLLVELQE